MGEGMEDSGDWHCGGKGYGMGGMKWNALIDAA